MLLYHVIQKKSTENRAFWIVSSLLILSNYFTILPVTVAKWIDYRIILDCRSAERFFLRSGDFWGELMEGIILFALIWSCFQRCSGPISSSVLITFPVSGRSCFSFLSDHASRFEQIMLLALGQIHFSPKSDHTPSLGWSRFPIRVEAAEGFFFCDFAGSV